MSFKESVTTLAKKVQYSAKENAPTLLTIGGAVGFVATVVVAAKQTTKLESILDETKEQIEQVHKAVEDPTAFELSPEQYTEEDGKKDLAIIYAKSAGKILKLYAVPIVLGTLTLAAMFGSNNISRKRKLEASAAYAALNKAFDNYRANIRERYGDEIDDEVMSGYRIKEVVEKKVKKDGTEVEKIKKSKEFDPEYADPYSFFFQEGVRGYTEDPVHNSQYVAIQFNELQKIFQRKQYISYNDIRTFFGEQPIPGGNNVGVVWDYTKPFSENKIDFGYDDIHNEAMRRFRNGHESVALIRIHNLTYDIDKAMRDNLYKSHKTKEALNA